MSITRTGEKRGREEYDCKEWGEICLSVRRVG